ncbi:MAG: hypothetical protein L0G99_07590 [Propionibacteriales bacterium]|nr:hypothetical protein [Propionibacteriales bacterium]
MPLDAESRQGQPPHAEPSHDDRPLAGADLPRWNRVLAITGVTLLGFGALAMLLTGLDGREILGEPAWAKPAKFGISFGIFCLSWAWMSTYVPARYDFFAQVLGVIIAVASAYEIAWVAIQAFRGTPSHFNNLTDLDQTLYSIAGTLVLVVWMATAILTVLTWGFNGIDRPFRVALRLGGLIALVGIALGFLMTVPTARQRQQIEDGQRPSLIGAHAVGVADDQAGLPFLGWSVEGGDLRIGHFVGIHALQLLPLIAVLLAAASRRCPRLASEAVRTRIVMISAGAYLAVTALVTVQALRGQPLLEPDLLTGVSALAILAASAAAITLVLHRAPPGVVKTRA